MIDYYNVLLDRLLDLYEKREGNVIRAIQITPSKEFKEYTDRYNHEAYRQINIAIEKLEMQNVIIIKKMKQVIILK